MPRAKPNFERHGSTTWPILVIYEPWVARNFLHMYCQSFGSIHVASSWVFQITRSHFPPSETMIPDFWKSCISQHPSGQWRWYIAGFDAHGMCIEFLNWNATFQNIFSTLIFAPRFGPLQTEVHTLPSWAFLGFHSAMRRCKALFMRFAAPHCTMEFTWCVRVGSERSKPTRTHQSKHKRTLPKGKVRHLKLRCMARSGTIRSEPYIPNWDDVPCLLARYVISISRCVRVGSERSEPTRTHRVLYSACMARFGCFRTEPYMQN